VHLGDDNAERKRSGSGIRSFIARLGVPAQNPRNQESHANDRPMIAKNQPKACSQPDTPWASRVFMITEHPVIGRNPHSSARGT
jgi:hypothetical protein